jgi:hypothetical protein
VESLYVDEFADRSVDWSQLSSQERAGHPAVQAAYVTCLDHFLGELLQEIEPVAAVRPVLLAVCGLYGGHWRTIPRRCELPPNLEAQRLRGVSIWWTGPCSTSRAILPGRSPALVQPFDLLPTLAEWFELKHRTFRDGRSLWPLFGGQQQHVRDMAALPEGVLWTEQDVTVLTNAETSDPATVRYFLWPEDLWQANDLGPQLPETVADRVRTYHLVMERKSTGLTQLSR